MRKRDLSLILSRALASPLGVAVTTNDPERLRAKLYNVRKNQLEFQELSFTLSPERPTTELWIVKNDAEKS